MTKENKNLIVKIIIAIILWLTALILENFILNDTLKSEIIYVSFYALSYLVVGYDVLFRALINIFRGNFLDELFLMSFATLGAWCMRFFGEREYTEAVAIMLFFQIGEVFEGIAVEKSRSKIIETMKLSVTVCELKDGRKIDPKDVNVGDFIVIKPGEIVPLDGISLNGGIINCQSLTGESLDVDLEKGDTVLSGSLNTTTPLEIEVTKKYEDSTATKILELVENSTMYKAKSEKFIDKFAKFYTPIVVIIAVLLALVPPTIMGIYHGFGLSDYRVFIKEALICLVISCPCAIVVSVPLTYFSGIGCAAKRKIIVKGSIHLEDLSLVDTIILDKTGTLTKAQFKIKEIIGDDKTELLKIAKGLESNSTHPLAKAINEEDGPSYEFEIEEKPGYGVIGKRDGIYYICGSKKLLNKYSIEKINIDYSGSILYIAKDNKCIGAIVLEDVIKDEAKNSISKLINNGKRVVVLSGDTKDSVESVCERLGIKEYYYSLLPEDKVRIAEEIIKSKDTRKVIFVGDGINDAPVLALSDVGVSMGEVGSDSAIEASDVVVLNDNLDALPSMIKIAKRTKKIVIENIILSISIKFIIMILSILSTVPKLNFELPMFVAIFGDVGVLIIAILNSLRALKE